jgi:hypothetical protein
MLFNIEGSFIDCTIEDSKLQKEEQKRGTVVALRAFASLA